MEGVLSYYTKKCMFFEEQKKILVIYTAVKRTRILKYKILIILCACIPMSLGLTKSSWLL